MEVVVVLIGYMSYIPTSPMARKIAVVVVEEARAPVGLKALPAFGTPRHL
jgi:hypothetical protein